MAQGKRPVVASGSTNFARGKTRGGSEVRIYADDAGGDYPIHGAWWYEAETRWVSAAWTAEGFCFSKEQPRSLDLNVKTLKFKK